MSQQRQAPAKPKVFIGSSSAGLGIAEQIQKLLIRDVSPTVWNQEKWLNKGTLERLMEILDKYDFGVFVLRPDDPIEVKGEKLKAARDNVLLEIGLFLGRHHREKVFIIRQNDADLRIASDLLGINFPDFSASSDEELAVACNDIKKQILEIWSKQQIPKPPEINPVTYEARMLYRILNAASSPQYKPIDSDLLTPVPIGEQSFADIEGVRIIAEELFYYYMFPHLKAAQNESQRLRVYFAYYLGDGVPLNYSPEPFYCIGQDEAGKAFKGTFVIGISTCERSADANWQSGLPLKGYEGTLENPGRALSNGAEAFRKVISLPIDDTDNPPWGFTHLNFKVEDERTVYSVPVVLSDRRWNKRETIAPIGILTVSGSEPNMINYNIKKRADHLAILLGFIFYLHVKQNPDVTPVGKEVNVNNIPVGFIKGTSPEFLEFVRRAVALRREVAKHFEEYFLQNNIHKMQGEELSYIPPKV